LPHIVSGIQLWAKAKVGCGFFGRRVVLDEEQNQGTRVVLSDEEIQGSVGDEENQRNERDRGGLYIPVST
jgi:hypothetical protein